ncbi:hypothetical protein O181_038459 [Austropuccinia psidii MF-1]|uniref:Uncharacterized protein n=1 Tax=Austropuccinia psidii MF-1 TaxID=1389203 RepID=A0A9Q3HDK6_9BASI|nr:hypothetical protein [Austropuccinia psidii MF-1]
MAIFGKNIQPFQEQINKEFSNKDIGPSDLLLGVKIQQLEDCITLHKKHFVDSLLGLYGVQKYKTVSTPLVPNEYLLSGTDHKEKHLKKWALTSEARLVVSTTWVLQHVQTYLMQ